jgi:hypothetical protein
LITNNFWIDNIVYPSQTEKSVDKCGHKRVDPDYYPLKNPDKTRRSEFVGGTSFLFGMKKNFLMSKSKSEDFVVSVDAGDVGESATFVSDATVVVVKKKASRSPSEGDALGGLGALSCSIKWFTI